MCLTTDTRSLTRWLSIAFGGVVAKRHKGIYRPGYRGWTKIKNPSYWRRESEIAQMQRSSERRARVASS